MSFSKNKHKLKFGVNKSDLNCTYLHLILNKDKTGNFDIHQILEMTSISQFEKVFFSFLNKNHGRNPDGTK